MQTLPWIVALVASTLLAVSLAAWAWRDRSRRREALPTEWELAARPLFTADERRMYRALREALPHHVLLSKVPLVRFCQPTDPGTMDYWDELLGDCHVGFAICSANGRVLAAIDLDSDRNSSRRVGQIKQAALGACRVRYLRCAVDQLPSVAELQLLVPDSGAATHAPQGTPPSPPVPRAAPTRPSETAVTRRSPRPVLWQDTTVFQDSFFATEQSLDDADDGFRPVPTRLTPNGQRSLSSRFFGGGETRRRGSPSVDFEPTRDALEDEDDLGEESGAAARFFPGSRP